MEALTKVRFFTQMFWLEGGDDLMSLMRLKKFRPNTLTITIRYSDWWYWEDNHALRMDTAWLEWFMGSVGLKGLKVEYETISRKRDEMMAIIERNKKFKLAVRGDRGHLSAENTKLTEWKWSGPSKLGGRTWYHHGQGDTIEYVVITDTWKYVADSGRRPPGILDYESDCEEDEVYVDGGAYSWETNEGENWSGDEGDEDEWEDDSDEEERDEDEDYDDEEGDHQSEINEGHMGGARDNQVAD